MADLQSTAGGLQQTGLYWSSDRVRRRVASHSRTHPRCTGGSALGQTLRIFGRHWRIAPGSLRSRRTLTTQHPPEENETESKSKKETPVSRLAPRPPPPPTDWKRCGRHERVRDNMASSRSDFSDSSAGTAGGEYPYRHSSLLRSSSSSSSIEETLRTRARRLRRHIQERDARDILLFLVAFRILNALCVRTFFQPDEFFQSLEPAWQIVFGQDSGAWITWVFTPHISFIILDYAALGYGRLKVNCQSICLGMEASPPILPAPVYLRGCVLDCQPDRKHPAPLQPGPCRSPDRCS